MFVDSEFPPLIQSVSKNPNGFKKAATAIWKPVKEIMPPNMKITVYDNIKPDDIL